MSKTYFVKTKHSEINLGYYQGNLENIALFLAEKSQSNEELLFTEIKILKAGKPSESSVTIEISSKDYANAYSSLDHEKHIINVGDSMNGKRVKISLQDDTEVIRLKALSKLSVREKEVLGIK